VCVDVDVPRCTVNSVTDSLIKDVAHFSKTERWTLLIVMTHLNYHSDRSVIEVDIILNSSIAVSHYSILPKNLPNQHSGVYGISIQWGIKPVSQ
jgi:hypothetical protein